MVLMLINVLSEILILRDKIEINLKQNQVDEIQLHDFSVEMIHQLNQLV